MSKALNPSLRVIAMVLLLTVLIIVTFVGGKTFFIGALVARDSFILLLGFASWCILICSLLYGVWSLLKGWS